MLCIICAVYIIIIAYASCTNVAELVAILVLLLLIVSEWAVFYVPTPHQHSIGYTGDGFYRSKDPTNSIKVLKEMLQNTKKTTETTKYRYT